MTALLAVRKAFHDPRTRAHRWVDGVVIAAVLLSIGIFVAELTLAISEPTATWLHWADQALLWFFVVEICLRIATYRPPELDFFGRSPARRALTHVTGRLKFAVSPLMVVDLLAVLAVYPALRGLRALRLLRLVRGLHLFRYRNPFEGLAQAFRDNRILYVFTFSALGTSVLVGGLCMYLVERGSNDSVQSMADGFWWALVTITTVGFGDITPQTGLGQAVGSVLMVAGLFMLALFAGVVGNTLLNAVLTIREEQFRMSGYIDHIVVCGYNHGAHMLLDRLIKEPATEHRQLVVFGPGTRPDSLPAQYIWVSGDPTKESELAKVRMGQAAAAIIVGTRDDNPERADAVTILTAFTIRRYLKDCGDPDRSHPLYIVCEILDSENVEHAESAGADEVIETTRLGFSLMAHAIGMHGTARTVSSVVTLGSQSLYVGSLGLDGSRSFGDMSTRLKRDYDALLIGVRRNGGHELINPDPDLELTSTDELLYIADGPVLSD